MTLTSSAGLFAVTVLDSTFTDDVTHVTQSQAPAKGTNAWTVRISDAVTGGPLDDLRVVVTPRMPDHNHGTINVVITPLGGGTYGVAPLYLYMGGLWNVKFDITRSGTATAAAGSAVTGAAGAAGGDLDAGLGAGPASDVTTFPICIPG